MRYISAARLALYRRALQQIVTELGGTEKLSRVLKVRTAALQRWLDGSEAMPYSVVLGAVDVIVDWKFGQTISERSEVTGALIETSRRICEDARAALVRSSESVHRAHRVKAAAEAGRKASRERRNTQGTPHRATD